MIWRIYKRYSFFFKSDELQYNKNDIFAILLSFLSNQKNSNPTPKPNLNFGGEVHVFSEPLFRGLKWLLTKPTNTSRHASDSRFT